MIEKTSIKKIKYSKLIRKNLQNINRNDGGNLEDQPMKIFITK